MVQYLGISYAITYSPEHGFQKGLGVTIKRFSPTVSFDTTFTKKEAGIGVSKKLGHVQLGAGVATEYNKWDPDWYIYALSNFKF